MKLKHQNIFQVFLSDGCIVAIAARSAEDAKALALLNITNVLTNKAKITNILQEGQILVESNDFEFKEKLITKSEHSELGLDDPNFWELF